MLRVPSWFLLLATLVYGLLAAPLATGAPKVGLLTAEGVLGPASGDYIIRGIERAAEDGNQLLIIQLDTPGGLDTSMRAVIKAMLGAPVPVVVYVAPAGARAASAGTFLLYASHVAAMAPGTSVGAATPVAIGMEPGGPAPERPARRLPTAQEDAAPASPRDASSTMSAKQVNDAAAYIRSLAQMRGRNAEWAEKAVRESASLSAEEALRQDVIEHVAADVASLLSQLDGQQVTVLGQQRTLHTKDAAVTRIVPDWRTELLAVITNPSIALLLMTIGIYGLMFEFMNPGFGVPGVTGAIALVLGLYALQLLPVNYAGLALILLGIAFMAAEAFLPSFGILGLGGVVAFVGGALILIDTELPGYGIPLSLVAPLGIACALLMFAVTRIALKTRKRAVTSGAAGMIGQVVRVESVAAGLPQEGWVRIEGELWHAVSAAPLSPDRPVRVLARDGLVLTVGPADQPQGG